MQLGCPVVSLTAHVPLFRHGKDVHISAKITKLWSVERRLESRATFLIDYMHRLVACAVTKTFSLYGMNVVRDELLVEY